MFLVSRAVKPAIEPPANVSGRTWGGGTGSEQKTCLLKAAEVWTGEHVFSSVCVCVCVCSTRNKQWNINSTPPPPPLPCTRITELERGVKLTLAGWDVFWMLTDAWFNCEIRCFVVLLTEGFKRCHIPNIKRMCIYRGTGFWGRRPRWQSRTWC